MRRMKFLVAALSFLALASCKKDNDVTPMPERPDVVFYALTNANQLMKYNARTAEMAEATVNISGLPMGEQIISIDFRPGTGQLYGLGSSSRLYTINYDNGMAMPLGTASFSPALSSSVASIDFNPTVDRIRLVTNNGQNLRLHPELGTVVATDGAINGAINPSITSIAYTNNFAGATSTDMFDIDVTNRKLFRQAPPNNGTLVEVGNINVDFTGRSGFDINADNTVMLATFMVQNKVQLYAINTMNAASTYLADLSSNNVVDIAIPTNAVAYAVTDDNMFQIFNPLASTAPTSAMITGLSIGESVVGIDFRPANSQLYALAVNGLGMARLYTINTSNAAATAVGSGFAVNTNSTSFGMDFNPTVDRLRIITNSGQNLRVNPNDGSLVATDANLNPGTPMATATAYTNNFAGATSTTMFVLDMGKLYRQDPPNNGTLVEIGSLGINTESLNGFDIGGRSNNAFAILTVNGTTRVYGINLQTGVATAGRNLPSRARAMAVGLGF
jgi:hypothetical protein